MKSHAQKEKERKHLAEHRKIYQGKIVELELETYKFDHQTKIGEIVHHVGAVVIVPIDPKGRILLVQQWRRAAKEILIELPAGTLEPNEPPDVCARRELQEETGFDAKTLTALDGFYSAPGYCTEYLHLFIAQDLHHSPLPHDEDEGIDLIPTSLEKAIQMIENNQIRDAKTIVGIYRYQFWKKK
ncbi:MAG: NUDIX hydrolase [Chlamydiae bacterium]|nr:NUDIX hydrolase [Chlamydiota bacterium]